MTAAPPTVHVVDDDASFARALARLLRARGLAAEVFQSAADFLARVPVDARGCVVLDLAMPEVDGLTLLETMTRRGHTMPALFLSGHGDIPSTVRAMRAGAEDFLTKLAPQSQLLEAVERALARDAQQAALSARTRRLRERFDALTPREVEVLRHVLRGRLNKQIAWALGIHERTVKLHRTSLTAKLRVSSVAELAQLVHEAGWEHEDPS